MKNKIQNFSLVKKAFLQGNINLKLKCIKQLVLNEISLNKGIELFSNMLFFDVFTKK